MPGPPSSRGQDTGFIDLILFPHAIDRGREQFDNAGVFGMPKRMPIESSQDNGDFDPIPPQAVAIIGSRKRPRPSIIQ